MSEDLGPDLDQLLPERGQRPVPHFLGYTTEWSDILPDGNVALDRPAEPL
jgi:hypothetical protein